MARIGASEVFPGAAEPESRPCMDERGEISESSESFELQPGYVAVLVSSPSSPWVPEVQALMSEFREMLGSLGVDIGEFQAFEDEMKKLPGKYAKAEGGELFVVLPKALGAKSCLTETGRVSSAGGGGKVGAASAASEDRPVVAKKADLIPISEPTVAKEDARSPHGGEASEIGTSTLVPGVGLAAGCIAFRCHDKASKVSEMKRMFVRPAHRGIRLGKSMGAFIMRRAKSCGYKSMLLDSLERLPGAIRTYEKLGFERIAAYIHNPMKDAVYMKVGL